MDVAFSEIHVSVIKPIIQKQILVVLHQGPQTRLRHFCHDKVQGSRAIQFLCGTEKGGMTLGRFYMICTQCLPNVKGKCHFAILAFFEILDGGKCSPFLHFVIGSLIKWLNGISEIPQLVSKESESESRFFCDKTRVLIHFSQLWF